MDSSSVWRALSSYAPPGNPTSLDDCHTLPPHNMLYVTCMKNSLANFKHNRQHTKSKIFQHEINQASYLTHAHTSTHKLK